ncbi:TPA: hypothetical protein NV714_001696 [Escherichia coli]|nr:hypothetical protein [Escherichia coli]
MKILNENESLNSIFKIVNYMEINRKKNESLFDYFYKNDVIENYQNIEGVKLTINDKIFFNQELIKEVFCYFFDDMKIKYSNLNPKSKIFNLECFDHEEYRYYDKEISFFNNMTIIIRLGFDAKTMEFDSSINIDYFKNEYSNQYKNDYLQAMEEKNGKLWFKKYIINKNIFMTKDLKIHVNKLVEVKEMINKFFIDYDKKLLNPLQLIKLNYNIDDIVTSNSKINYNNVKLLIEKNKYDIIYSYSNIYLSLLSEKINKKCSILETNTNSLNILTVSIKNIYLKNLLDINYDIYFNNNNENKSSKIYLYSKDLLIFTLESKNGNVFPDFLSSFIECAVKNKIKEKKGKIAIIKLQNKIKDSINNKSIDIKINLDKLILNENSILIKIIFNNQEIDIEYNENKITDINKVIDSFVEDKTLSNIFNSKNNENKKKRL